MSAIPSKIFVVDDDPLVRTALRRVITSAGHDVWTFASAAEFLESARSATPACVVLDIRLPDVDGIELHRRMREIGASSPVIFLTGFGDIAGSVRAMKSGAVDYLPKPVSEETLLRAIEQALLVDAESRAREKEAVELAVRFNSLTPRECEVFGMVVAGRLNKQIARELRISEKTVKVHRARVMAKMHAPHVAQLVAYGIRLKGRERERERERTN
jgi:FixJ family two-component response regulator